MAFACWYDVPADESIYRRVGAEIGNDDGNLRPDGLIVHLVVTSPVGLRHYQVWDTKADWERFRDDVVLSAVGRVFAAAGFDGAPPPAVEEELTVVDVNLGRAA